jgi:phosphoribosyl 1,2-cyclic phosphodiesterase
VKLSILASGSGGNALYLEAEGTRVLVDAGVALRELRKRLNSVPGSPTPESLDALLLTHEHSDHAGHARTLVERGVVAHATVGTAEALGILAKPFVHDETFRVGAFEVRAIPLPHDAADPVGFVIGAEGARIGILVDCGHPDPQVARAYAGCDVLVIEANHDPEMLRYGNYPMSLKRRIGGQMGHLSNDEAAQLVRAIPGPPPRLIVLAHLSQMNNRPQLARAAMMRALGRKPVRLLVAAQARVMPPIHCSGEGVHISGGVPGEQLQLRFENAS